jgi:ADP-L-glycero-D-manno-heptose 6-epimerase
MLVITGALGFIGSYLLSFLNQKGHRDIILVDDFSREEKLQNIAGKKYLHTQERVEFLQWLDKSEEAISFIFHLGARTDTTLKDQQIFDDLNIHFTQKLIGLCARKNIPLLYASSAATYGLGEKGFSDMHDSVVGLQPLNPYGWSKQVVDEWILNEVNPPVTWYGLKFFNVYGPNEYHKGRMASVVWHAYNQIRSTGKMKLFRSHREEIVDGHQSRDFIYIKDVVSRCYDLYTSRPKSGIYNVGTGEARTFLDLTRSVFKALEIPENIEFIDTPEDIRETYQYYTCSDQNKYGHTGLDNSFISLEDGVKDYVRNYLLKDQSYY